MYKVLLVDDEYMITEGLKKLIPFDHWNMEVVATAEDADQALDYVREYPVDVVITLFHLIKGETHEKNRFYPRPLCGALIWSVGL